MHSKRSSGPVGDRFAGRIGPGALAERVSLALPWWQADAQLVNDPLLAATNGWQQTLSMGLTLKAERSPGPAARIQYFALCLACHHATVASFSPTDVDAFIRGAAWTDREPKVLADLTHIAVSARSWSIRGLNPRYCIVNGETVSGHDGEMLGVMAGAVGGWARRGQWDRVEQMAALIDQELQRESAIIQSIEENDDGVLALLTAAIVTHNVGDLDQGLSHWPPGLAPDLRQRWTDLAHAFDRFHGNFAKAAAWYAATLAPEGHRNYPLRKVACLRRSPELWLPMGPFLDGWGVKVATSKDLGEADRRDVVEALLHGIATIPGQQGYQRALAGMATVAGWDRLVRGLDANNRTRLQHPLVKEALSLSAPAFHHVWHNRWLTLRAQGTPLTTNP